MWPDVTRFFNIWPISIKENLLNGILNLLKYVKSFAKYQIGIPSKIAKHFKDFAKAAKFGQIWSPC